MVYAQRISQHFENGRRDEIRIFFPAKLMRKMKLQDYRANPIELRWREFHKSLRERPDQIQVSRHWSQLYWLEIGE